MGLHYSVLLSLRLLACILVPRYMTACSGCIEDIQLLTPIYHLHLSQEMRRQARQTDM